MYWAAQYIHLNVPYIYLNVQSYKVWKWFFFLKRKYLAWLKILWPPHAKSWLIGKDPDAGRDWGQEEEGMTEDEMAGWHHRLDGHGFGWTPGVGDGQGGLACCGSWGRKELDTTEQLNWTELKPLTTLLVFPSFYFFKYQDNKMVSFLGTLWELFKIYTEVEFFWWGSMFASASVLWRQAIHSHFKLTYLFGFFRSQK